MRGGVPVWVVAAVVVAGAGAAVCVAASVVAGFMACCCCGAAIVSDLTRNLQDIIYTNSISVCCYSNCMLIIFLIHTCSVGM